MQNKSTEWSSQKGTRSLGEADEGLSSYISILFLFLALVHWLKLGVNWLQGIDPDAVDENDENDVEDVDGDTEDTEIAWMRFLLGREENV